MTAPPISPVEEIAGRLSEAQRRALTDVLDLGWALITKIETGRSAKALHQRGLTSLSWAPSSLTPLGLQVRDHLRATLNPEGTDHG